MRPPDFPLSYCRPGICGFLVLAFAPAVFAQSPPTLLVRQGDTWNYRKGTSEPPADWTTVAEASLDGTWQGGVGGFGYGDDDDATVLDDMEDGYLTVSTRKSFEITPAMDPTRHLRLSLDYDDACIIYLDGREVFRSFNIAEAAGSLYSYDQETLTENHDSAGAGGGPVEVVNLGPLSGLLTTGTHILAAQGINASIDSSDFSLIVTLALGDAPTDVTWTLADSPVTLTSDFAIGGGRTLTIEAGVEVILSAGINILALEGSRIDIAGTPTNPVILRPADENDWGELSVTGNGGMLTARHAEIAGGQVRFLTGVTGLMEDCLIHDSGASSIINAVSADTVTLRRCCVVNYAETLFRNTLTLLEQCLFEAPTADAVDFDAAKPGSTIRQCTFRNGPSGSNTDAIDIGPTGGVPSVDVMIEDCLMHNFSDKGVSIGDGPDDADNIIVRNCLMFDIARGVQVKHASVVKVQNCTIVDALIGLHGFEKSGATGGGIFTETYNTIVATSTEAVELETNSTFAISYSATQGQDWPGVGNLNVDPLFRDPTNRDYRLLAGSPCLGTGRNGEDMGISYPIGGVPDVPSNLQVVSFDGDEAVLSWTDPDTKESRFVIEKSADGMTWTVAAVASANAIGATLSGLAENPVSFFRVHGANFLGTSFNSEPVAAEKLTVDTDPRRILHIDSITLDSSRKIQLYFAAQADRSYVVEYSTTLQAGAWKKLADIPSETRARPVVVVSDTPPAATPKRFYRLITSP